MAPTEQDDTLQFENELMRIEHPLYPVLHGLCSLFMTYTKIIYIKIDDEIINCISREIIGRNLPTSTRIQQRITNDIENVASFDRYYHPGIEDSISQYLE